MVKRAGSATALWGHSDARRRFHEQGLGMTGLVEQLQADAMNSAVSVADLLRKAKAVAIKLNQNELVGWLESEMSGYALGATLPEYRLLAAPRPVS